MPSPQTLVPLHNKALLCMAYYDEWCRVYSVVRQICPVMMEREPAFWGNAKRQGRPSQHHEDLLVPEYPSGM